MKKVLAAVLLCAVSSVFAQWDNFPVIEDGKAEAKIGYVSARQGYVGGGGLSTFKVRYSPIANLELRSELESSHIIGARYQIIPVLSAGLDVGVPIPTPEWRFAPNVQFSMPITEALLLGSNFKFTLPLENSQTKETDFMRIDGAVELDLVLSAKSTIWVEFDIGTGLGEEEVYGVKKSAKEAGRGLELGQMIGYVASVDNLSVGTNVAFKFGEDAGHDNVETRVGVDASVRF